MDTIPQGLPNTFGVGEHHLPVLWTSISTWDMSECRWSILTNRWKLAALACVRNLGMMDPVYPTGKEWKKGTELGLEVVVVVGECGEPERRGREER